MSEEEFIEGRWDYGGEEGKRGSIWKPPARKPTRATRKPTNKASASS
jgi:hypothetical protein